MYRMHSGGEEPWAQGLGWAQGLQRLVGCTSVPVKGTCMVKPSEDLFYSTGPLWGVLGESSGSGARGVGGGLKEVPKLLRPQFAHLENGDHNSTHSTKQFS